MARQNSLYAGSGFNKNYFVGRHQSAWRQRWPAPGQTYTRESWPPRGRGRGESLLSPRRIEAKLRTCQVIKMRAAGHTWQTIARALGFKDASGPYRAMKRAIDRVDSDNQQKGVR